tara:strand:+ start:1958 stop:2338 length:381 start_codon:yes stop_codon:yes gene_type:complete
MANTNDLFSIATGYFGSAYLDATTSDESVQNLSASGEMAHHVVAITMLQECTFTTLTAYQEGTKHSAYIETGANTAFGKAIATSDTFPTGVTIYGRWSAVTLNTGKCIVYMAPASGAHPGLNSQAS